MDRFLTCQEAFQVCTKYCHNLCSAAYFSRFFPGTILFGRVFVDRIKKLFSLKVAIEPGQRESSIWKSGRDRVSDDSHPFTLLPKSSQNHHSEKPAGLDIILRPSGPWKFQDAEVDFQSSENPIPWHPSAGKWATFPKVANEVLEAMSKRNSEEGGLKSGVCFSQNTGFRCVSGKKWWNGHKNRGIRYENQKNWEGRTSGNLKSQFPQFSVRFLWFGKEFPPVW